MHFQPNEVYHIYNRGNNKQRIFFSEKNYQFFLNKVKIQLSPICKILSWCLMPNHFHFLIAATEKSCLERPTFGGKPMQELPYKIGVLLSSYSQAINKQNNTIGSLFQQKTKSKCVTDQYGRGAQSDLTVNSSMESRYIITCMHYIHQNPYKAEMVTKLEDWPYSSFQQYIGNKTILRCDIDLMLSLTGYEIENLYEDSYGVIDEEGIL